MDANPLDSWTAVVSESSPTVIDKLSKLIDFGDPPDLFEFVCQQWEQRVNGVLGTWELLMEGQFILRTAGCPTIVIETLCPVFTLGLAKPFDAVGSDAFELQAIFK